MCLFQYYLRFFQYAVSEHFRIRSVFEIPYDSSQSSGFFQWSIYPFKIYLDFVVVKLEWISLELFNEILYIFLADH